MKNIGGLIVTVVLVLMLTQYRYIDFFMNTIYGRIILILLILGITVSNKVLGIIAVLFTIILYNHSGIGYMEGFTNDNEKETTGKEAETKKKSAKVGHEGFNMVEKEGLMMRGKQSKSVPVNVERGGEVNPSDSSPYSSSFASV